MKTVIFDMDGVLVDSEPFHCAAWIQTYREHGIEIDEEFYFKRICGSNEQLSTAMVTSHFNKDIDCKTLIIRKGNITGEKVKDNITPISGAIDLVKDLVKNKYKLGLASSTNHVGVDAILNTIGLKDAFSIIHSGESVKNGKPHPEVYNKTAKMLCVSPNNCVVVEDTKSGILSAKEAGMKVIGVLNGKNSQEDIKHADKIVEKFSEITIEMIENLN